MKFLQLNIIMMLLFSRWNFYIIEYWYHKSTKYTKIRVVLKYATKTYKNDLFGKFISNAEQIIAV